MLGRPEMDLEFCTEAYDRLTEDVFGRWSKKIDWRLHVKGQASPATLETAVKSMVAEREKILPRRFPTTSEEETGHGKCRSFHGRL